MKPTQSKRLLSRRKLMVGAGLVAAAVPLAALPARYADQVYPGATVQGVRLNGLTRDEAITQLRSHFTAFEQRAATFHFETEIWTATLAELGGTIDYDATINAAMQHGRDSMSDRYTEFFAADDSAVIEPVISLNADKTRDFLETIAPAIDIDARNARLVRGQGEIQTINSEDGRSLDRDAAIQAIQNVVESGDPGEVTFTTNVVLPEVATEALEENKNQAFTLIGDQIVLTHRELNYPITAEQLAQALVIDRTSTPKIDATRIPDRINAIEADLYVPPTNVMLGWDDGLHVVNKDVDGLEMDREATEALIAKLASSATARSAELPTKLAKAAARADNMNELGIDGHLAQGSSSFAGSSYERATNVGVAANNISYKLVAPGEIFSFNALMGAISTDAGFISGTIISGDWVATDIGGGVCQTSTTVFRAAANAGFQFTEWHAHTWRLAFYEIDGSPPGFDAAIYQPNGPGEMTLDLSWENMLDSWLLIMTVVAGETVTAHLYGKDPGWTVVFGDVSVSEPIQPDKPVERENPNFARGERQWKSGAAPGYEVTLPRTVTGADGTVISEGSFVSNYLPQPEVWEVGPK